MNKCDFHSMASLAILNNIVVPDEKLNQLNDIIVPASLKKVQLHNLLKNHDRRVLSSKLETLEGRPRQRILISNLRGDKCAKAIEEYRQRRPATAPAAAPVYPVFPVSKRRSSLKPPPVISQRFKKKVRRRSSTIIAHDKIQSPSDSRTSIPSDLSTFSTSESTRGSLPDISTNSLSRRPMTAPALFFTPAKTRKDQLKTVQGIMDRFRLRGIEIDEKSVERAILPPEEILHTCI
jgi:hypothetical protein